MKTIRLMMLFTSILLANSSFSQAPKSIGPGSRDFEEVKAAIVRILSDKVEIYDKRNQLSGDPQDIVVLDDRIEFKIGKQESAINFTDFLDESLQPANYRKTKIVMVLDKYEFITNGWVKSNFKKLEELRQNLIYIQNQTRKSRNESQLRLFEQAAAKYRQLTNKPIISEEQRKFIVQANSNNQQRIYEKAIELYKKAIEVDPVAYPAAYSNLALLSAQVNKFDDAIYYMKKYLLLEPDGSDARGAQDKIYEWEAMIGK